MLNYYLSFLSYKSIVLNTQILSAEYIINITYNSYNITLPIWISSAVAKLLTLAPVTKSKLESLTINKQILNSIRILTILTQIY